MSMIAGRISLSEIEHKDAPLWWHKQNLQQTASGYGRKLVSRKMIKYNKRWRRVYVCLISNAGTAYIEDANGNWIVIDD
jgi:hypothetical protein